MWRPVADWGRPVHIHAVGTALYSSVLAVAIGDHSAGLSVPENTTEFLAFEMAYDCIASGTVHLPRMSTWECLWHPHAAATDGR